jgi:predicted nuclease of restriction endonuclease-like RecB superfamily
VIVEPIGKLPIQFLPKKEEKVVDEKKDKVVVEKKDKAVADKKDKTVVAKKDKVVKKPIDDHGWLFIDEIFVN